MVIWGGKNWEYDMKLRIIFSLWVTLFSLGQSHSKPLTFDEVTLTDFSRRVFQSCPIRFATLVGDGAQGSWGSDEKAFETYEEFSAALNAFCLKQAKDSSFRDKDQWFERYVPRIREASGIEHKPFVQKAIIPNGSEVLFCGDLHGSIHSLLRTLWRLRIQGYLNDDFKIRKPNFYMVFCGDYVDRGKDGCEVIYAICKLKDANWKNVFVLRGNHEEEVTSKIYGFLGNGDSQDKTETEIGKKFGAANFAKAEGLVREWYSCLPYALFLNNMTDSWIQCCHGGVEKKYSPKAFIKAHGKLFQQLSKKDQEAGLNWSDIVIGKSDDNLGYLAGDPITGQPVQGIAFNNLRGRGWVTSVGYVEDYLRDNGLKALIRGHADQFMWLKMFFPQSEIKGELGVWVDSDGQGSLNSGGTVFVSLKGGKYKFQNDSDATGNNYFNGPYNWRKVLSDGDLANPEGFLLRNYCPIYTLTHAYESRSLVREEGYGIVKMSGEYEAWRFKAYPYVFADILAVMKDRYIDSIGMSDHASEESSLRAGSSQDQLPLLTMRFAMKKPSRSLLPSFAGADADEAEIMQPNLRDFLRR